MSFSVRFIAFATLSLTTSSCGTVREQPVSGRDVPATGLTAAALTSPSERNADAGVDAGQDSGADASDVATTQDGDAGDGGSLDAAADPTALTPPIARTGALAHFYSALDGLSNHTRKDHVRILWLGDSHGQADFWSGRLRTLLQKRFGNGGPGFVHIAFKGYRHDGVDVSMKDKWATLPKGPATGQPTADGVFGLGGLLTSTTSTGAEATIEIRDMALPAKLHFDLCYRFMKGSDALRVSLTGNKPMTLSATGKQPAKPPLLHTKLVSGPPTSAQQAQTKADKVKPKGARLDVAPTSGVPYFCGVVIETDPLESPGVVLDTLGINGARYTTALAWDEEAWLTELARRSPALVIFEYGTNEAGDVGIKVESYADKVAKLVERVRKKKSDTDCAILAPTERADQEERSARIRDILNDAAKANGCFFWDTVEKMGGKGSMRAWRAENPPKGAKDGVHLTVRGYQELGDKLTADLLRKY